MQRRQFYATAGQGQTNSFIHLDGTLGKNSANGALGSEYLRDTMRIVGGFKLSRCSLQLR